MENLLLALKTKDIIAIVVICVAIVLLALCIFLIKLRIKNGKHGIKIIDGVRYTANDKPEDKKTQEQLVTFNQEDVILAVNDAYVVSKKKGRNKILPGTYTVLSSDENVKTFNIRIGTKIRSFEHNTQLVLAEGDDVSPTTISVILR